MQESSQLGVSGRLAKAFKRNAMTPLLALVALLDTAEPRSNRRWTHNSPSNARSAHRRASKPTAQRPSMEQELR
jgi:hypothetical protein